MPKPKNIVIPAASGFVLSFLISIIATRHFLRSLLRAGLTGIVFAALAVGVLYLFDHFLAEGAEPVPSLKGSTGGSSGSRVDITIGDEELTPDDGPKFKVSGEIKAPLSTGSDAGLSGVPAEQPATQDADAKGFTPVSLGAGAAQPAAGGQPAAANGTDKAQSLDSLDTLPDIGDLNLVSAASGPLVEDSEFAEEGKRTVRTNAEFSDGSNAASKDAETMAKAIRTLLKSGG